VEDKEGQTLVHRQIRVVHGAGESATGQAEMWMYVPCEPKTATSNQPRRGFWLDGTNQSPGIYALRASEAIQKKGCPGIKDVAVMHDFPFTRLVKFNKHKEEMKNTIRFITARPLVLAELLAANKDLGDDDSSEDDDDYDADEGDDDDADSDAPTEAGSGTNTSDDEDGQYTDKRGMAQTTASNNQACTRVLRNSANPMHLG
jgi:hypothetical protein